MSTPRPKQRSVVWKYFKKINDYQVSCNLCQKIMKFFGGTTNLQQHLRRRHPTQKLEIYLPGAEDFGEVLNSNNSHVIASPTSQVIFVEPVSVIPQTNIHNAESVTATSTRKKRSVFWNYFKKIDDKEALCNLCQKTIRHFGGTTNLKQHLRRVHPKQSLGIYLTGANKTLNSDNFHAISNARTQVISPKPSSVNQCEVEPDISMFLTRLSSVDPTATDLTINGPPVKPLEHVDLEQASELTDAKVYDIHSKLVKMITRDYQPLSIVEDKGFLEYSQTLQPLYVLPSKKQLINDIIPKYYEEAALELKSILKNIKNVAITVDIWTSDCSQSYITVTCHFIHDDKLYARVLATQEILESHTEEEILGILTRISEEWNIINKIVTVASNKEYNVKKVRDYYIKTDYPCIAYTLHVCMTNTLSINKELNAVLEKCRALVSYFKNSIIASDKLRTIQQEMGLPILKMKREVAIRWNSCFTMIERLNELKNPLCVAISSLPESPEFLDGDDWELLGDCLNVLKPVYTLTSILCEEKYPTISQAIPLIRAFQFKMNKLDPNTTVGQSLKNKLFETIMQILGDFEQNKFVAMACFLDPRFKKVGFRCDDNATLAEKWVSEELTQLIAQKISETEIAEVNYCSELKENDSTDDDFWDDFDKKASEKTCSPPTTLAMLILRQYLEISLLDRKKDSLEFWAQHKLMFPELYELAMKYLCIPSTSVPSETLFSKVGQLTHAKRSRLTPKNLDYIVFLNSTH